MCKRLYDQDMTTKGFCAFCKSPRKFYAQKRLGIKGLFSSLLIGIALSYILEQAMSPSALFIMIVIAIMLDLLTQVRWRYSVICKECGFDPVLYKKDSQRACERVKNRLEERKKDQILHWTRPLKLPVRKIKVDPVDNGLIVAANEAKSLELGQ